MRTIWCRMFGKVIAVLFCAAVFLCCAAFCFSLTGTDSSEVTAQAETSETQTEKTVEYAPKASGLVTFYSINGTDNANVWNSAMEMSVNNAVQVTVMLNADWTAVNGSFGSGTGFTETGGLRVPENADIVLDLNNHTLNRGLTASSASNIIKAGTVLSGVNCKLTLNDSSLAGNGTITGGYSNDTFQGGAIGVFSSEFIMNGGHLKNNYGHTGGGFYAQNSVCNLYGGVSENNGSNFGAGMYFHNNTVANLYDGFTARKNTAIRSGGVFESFVNCTITINGGLYTENHSNENAGAFYVTSGSVVTINGGTVTNNTVNGHGGAVYAASKFSISGGEIYNNYRITDQTTGAKELENVYITSIWTKMVITGQLQNTQKIGITVPADFTGGFTTGYSSINSLAPSNYFFDEKNGKQIILNTDGEAEIGTEAAVVPSVTLTWQYTTDGGANWQNVSQTSATYSGAVYELRAMNGTTGVNLSIRRYTDLNGNSSNITLMKNVGTYTFMVDNSAGTYTNPSLTFDITQVTVSITWNGSTSLTYNGSPQRPTATMGNVSAADKNQLAFVYDNGLESSAVNVGSYSTSITGLSGSKADNYKLPTGGTSRNFQIVAAKLVKPVGVNGLIYNGKSQSLLIGVTDKMQVTGDTAGIAAKTYTATIKIKDTRNYVWSDSNNANPYTVNIVISPKTLQVGGVTLKEKEYDGTTTIAAGSLQGSYVLTGFETTADENNIKLVVDASQSNYSSKDVGYRTATVKISLSGTGKENYKLLSDSYTFGGYITKSTLKVTKVTATDKDYDGNISVSLTIKPQDVKRIITGAGETTGYVAGDDVTITAFGTFANANAGTNKTINISSYTLSGANKDNYIIDYTNSVQTGTANINKKNLKVTVSAVDCVYGNVPAVSYSVTDTSGNAITDNITVNLTYANGTDSTTVLKTAGVYTITAALTSNFAVNYNLASVIPDGGAVGDPLEVEITKAPLSIIVNDASVAYGGGKVNNGAIISGFVWNDTRASVGLEDSDLTFTYGDFDTDSGAIGTYVLSIDVSALTVANYTLNVADGVLAVGTKTLTVELTVTDGVYGGTAVTATATAKDGTTPVTVTFKYEYSGTSYDGTAVSGTTAPVKPGEYTVKATITTAGYNGTDSKIVRIGRAALTVAVTAAATDSDKVEYGTAISDLTTLFKLDYTGFVNGDTATAVDATSVRWESDYFTFAPVGTYTVAASGVTSDNYDITYTSGTLTVNKANATVTVKNASSVYDANVPTVGSAAGTNYTVTGLKRAADDLGVTLSIASAAANAGKYDLTATASNTNYNVTFAGETASNTATNASGTWTIKEAYEVLKAALTITADNKSIAYGESAPTYTATYEGFKGTDDENVFTTPLSLTCTYVAGDATNGQSGTYTITASGAAAANYTISFVNGTLSVGIKNLTVELTVTDGVYGGTAVTATATAKDGTTPVTVTFKYEYTGTSYDGTLVSGTTVPVKPGKYTVKATITTAGYNGTDSKIVRIGRAALTVAVTAAATDSDKVEYGTEITDLTTLFKLDYTGFVNGDTATAVDATSVRWESDYFTFAPVGTYTVAASGVASDNYDITYTSGTLTVNKANATVTVKNATSVYDANVPTVGSAAGTNYTVTGLKRAADDLGVSLSIASAAANAGKYDLTATASNTNYNVTFVGETAANAATEASGVWTIKEAYEVLKAALTITADDKEITYGESAPAYTATYEGFKGTDDENVFTTPLSLTCTYVAGDATNGQSGTYTITASGAAAANYTISFVNGTLSVGIKNLTVELTVTDGVYGGTAVTATATAKDGTTPVTVTFKYEYEGTSYDGTAVNGTTAPVKPGEYTVKATITTAGYNGTDTKIVKIGRAALTVAVTASSTDSDKVEYGTAISDLTTLFKLDYTGFVNGDTATAVDATSVRWQSDYFTFAPVGTYTVAASGVTSDNYNITYTNGTLTVNKANATVTVKNASSVYDANVPTIRSAAGTNYTVTGLKRAADDLGVSLSIASAAANAGKYDLTATASNTNYNVTFAGETAANTATSASGTWTIKEAYEVLKAALTITADDKEITYGESAPTYTATYEGFKGTDDENVFTTPVSLTCTYVALDMTNGQSGTYTITASGAAAANYDITLVNGTLIVGKKSITVTIDNTKTTSQFGCAVADFTRNTSSFYTFDASDLAQAGDDLGVTLTTTATSTSNAGIYPITAVSANANYDVTFENCLYTVTQFKLKVVWTDANDADENTSDPSTNVWTYEYNGAAQGPKAFFIMPDGTRYATAGTACMTGWQKNVGTGYSATVVIPATAQFKINYTFDENTSNSHEFSVIPKQLTVTWSGTKNAAGTFEYEFNGGVEQHPVATFGGIVTGDTVTPVYSGASGMVGTGHTVTVSTSNNNYSLPADQVTARYNIIRMSLNSFFWTYDGTNAISGTTYNYVYDGNTHLPTALAGVSVTFSYTVKYSDGTDSGNCALNAGSYTVTATPSDSNYVIPASKSNTFTFTISAREVRESDIRYNAVNFIYNGANQQPEAWYEDVHGARIMLAVTVDGDHSAANAGGAYYTAKIARPDDGNYAFTGGAASYEKNYTIAPKDINVEWTLNGGAWVTDFTDDYSGREIVTAASAKMIASYGGELADLGLAFEITRKDNATSTESEWTGPIKDAGIYTLKAYVSNSALAGNYRIAQASRQITVNKLRLDIAVNGGNDYSVNYNAEAPEFSADFTGFLNYTDGNGQPVDEGVTVKSQVESVDNWIFSDYSKGCQPGTYTVGLTTNNENLRLLREYLRNYDWEANFVSVRLVVNATQGSVLVLADNGSNEFIYDGTFKLPEAFYVPVSGNGSQRKLNVSLLTVNPDGSTNEYLTDGKALNEGTYYIGVSRVDGDNDRTELITDGLYFKIVKRTVLVKISDIEVPYGEVTRDNRSSFIVTEYLTEYCGRNGYQPLAADKDGLAINVDCNFELIDGTENYDAQGYAQAGNYLIRGSWNSADYGRNYDVMFIGSQNGGDGHYNAGLFTVNKAEIMVISEGDAYFEEYGDFDSSNPRYVIKLAEKDENGFMHLIYSGNKRPGNTDAEVSIKYADKQKMGEHVEPASDSEYYLTDAPRITAAGDWVIYYKIDVDGGNHETLYGVWRVQVRPESDYIIVLFTKEFVVPYGDGVPENLTSLLYEGGYYNMGNNTVSKEWFRDNATAYVYGVTEKSEVGLYNIAFKVNEGVNTGSLEYSIKYNADNYTAPTNLYKYRIEQRLLSVEWSEELEFVHDGKAHIPSITVKGWIDGGELKPEGITADGEQRFVYKDGERSVIVTVAAEGDFTSIGGHKLTVSVGNSNYRLDVNNAAKAISIKADTVVEYGHLPTWAWYAIGGGAAVALVTVAVLAVKLKKRKAFSTKDDDGFYDDAD